MEHYQLDNGLQVIVAPLHGAPVAAIQAWVNVGSVDETPAQAGIAHMFEHMLFKGTERRGVGEIAREVEHSGGEINAWTSFHNTVYHVVMASQYLDTGIEILADALMRSSFDPGELTREREVIVEEILQAQDDPMRSAMQLLFATAFPEHPYGRPVSGSIETVRALSRQHLLSFYRRWYVANNITLVVAGDMDAGAAKQAIKTHFGAMQHRRLTRQRHAAPRPMRLRSAIARRDESQAFVATGFPIPPIGSPELPALDVAAIALGQGESSRLVRTLHRDRELVAGIYSYANPMRDAGVFLVNAMAAPERVAEATEATAAELARLSVEELDLAEIDRARRAIEANLIFQRETAQGMARRYGYYFAALGDPEFEDEYLNRIRNLTPADVRTVAAKYLTAGHAAIAAVLPSSKGGKGSKAGQGALSKRTLVEKFRQGAQAGLGRVRVAQRPKPASRAIKAGDRAASGIIREVLPNGVRVIVKPDSAIPVVAIRAAWAGGVRLETPAQNGVTEMLARLITRGCGGMKNTDILAKLDQMAGSMSGSSGRNSFGLRGEWLAERWEEGLELMATCLKEPTFPEDELAREKRQLLDELRARDDNPTSMVFRTFAETLYRKHPYRLDTLGEKEPVEALSRRRIQSHYRRHYPMSGLTIAIVGAVDARRAVDLVKRHFADAGNARPPEPQIPAELFTGRPRSEREAYRYLDRNQAHVIVGFPGSMFHEPDRYALEVLTTLLGGQGGRLFVELRDRRALAYRVGITSVEGLDPGYIAVYMSCSPDKLSAAVEGIRAELTKSATEPVSADELARAKRYLIGTYAISQQRRAGVAAALAFHEAYGLGYERYLEYTDAVSSVTAADVARVAAKYLDWDLAVVATVTPLAGTPEAVRRMQGVRKKAPRKSRKERR